MAKDDLEKLLVEATANENWNISNTKMLQISDATYDMGQQSRVMDYLFNKLQASKPFEWRRILKTLNTLEFICKNGSPSCVMQLRRETYKLSSLNSF